MISKIINIIFLLVLVSICFVKQPVALPELIIHKPIVKETFTSKQKDSKNF